MKVLLAFILASILTLSKAECNGNWEHGVWYTGNDIVVNRKETPGECQKLCKEVKGCVGWAWAGMMKEYDDLHTYIDPDKCFLKSKLENRATGYFRRVSGTRNACPPAGRWNSWGNCFLQNGTCIRRRTMICDTTETSTKCNGVGTSTAQSLKSLSDLKLPKYLHYKVKMWIMHYKIKQNVIEETQKCSEDSRRPGTNCVCSEDDYDVNPEWGTPAFEPDDMDMGDYGIPANMCIDFVDYCSSEDVNVREFMYWRCSKTCKCLGGLEPANTNFYIKDEKTNYNCKVSFKFKNGEIEKKIIIKKLDASCSESASTDCLNGIGEDYLGSVSKTVSGFPCQKWSIQSDEEFSSVGDHNYCRNPDGEAGLWCFSTKPGEEWNFCDVPACEYKDSIDITGKHQFNLVSKNGTKIECSLRAALGHGSLCLDVLEDTLQCNVGNGNDDYVSGSGDGSGDDYDYEYGSGSGSGDDYDYENESVSQGGSED